MKNDAGGEAGLNSQLSNIVKGQRDPLLWFGAFVSPKLRNSQADFRIVLDLVANLASATAQMRKTESEIGRTRKQRKKLRDARNASS